LKTILKICRKGAIYLSKKILESLGAQEGDHLSVKVENGKLILEVIPDPLLLAARTKKWAGQASPPRKRIPRNIPRRLQITPIIFQKPRRLSKIAANT